MIDLVGQRFGRLVVLSYSHVVIRSGRSYHWLCRCDCGVEKTVARDALVRGLTKSCGCFAAESRRKKATKHGHAGRGNGGGKVSKEYRAWVNMKTRCFNPNSGHYSNYGGRGITVCDRWKNSFPAFLEDLGRAPESHLTLERIDVNKGYSPDNCRWADRHDQDRNRTDNHWLEYKGERITLTDLAIRTGVRRNTITARLELGVSVEEAVGK